MAIRTLGPGSLTIGETGTPREWGADITSCKVTPSVNSEDDVPMLDGSNMDGEDTVTYTLDGTIQQNFDADSLQQFIWENRNTILPFVFTPTTAGKASASGSVKLQPIDFGGDVKTRPTSDFSFKIINEPTFDFSGS